MYIADRNVNKGIPLLIMLVILHGCTSVKPYQRVYLNDAAMKAGKPAIEKFEEGAHTYREGASGGGNGKTSGGCGCN